MKTNHNTTLGDLKEAIEELEHLYGETVLELSIYASSDYGDRAHTEQILPMQQIEVHTPMTTSYSGSGLSIDTSTEHEPAHIFPQDVCHMAVVLRKGN
jgi:hypothetical protein